jgi:hypothetical protein
MASLGAGLLAAPAPHPSQAGGAAFILHEDVSAIQRSLAN